ncbi:TPA: AraC family transcriptional regulator [Salmonella enterica subsp. enterica serovar Reading]|uniref:Helix-turn-helix transcriptional regulator n=1 Tax=Salmonella enterica TaxID=28901 RepID=A0A759QKR6_SALER|nr:helix-turn-helix transcriptional regulator [Salmonella enterica]HAK0844906.1 helix-turn-helix transcriptional regulator [Salmonella enterica]HEC9709705.1 AraC family transcriptional regulator [Salmonella enterica subsp. enterica serovar Muenchen]HED0221710.1 AraC family transcriptional regulator [Salmonella enterica subsp. enterica serovar Muenchen]
MIKIFKWIDKNIEQRLTIDDIVKISGYSRRHLHNIFIRHSGKSVAEYIRLKRLKRASFLLKLTNLTITDISERLNFDSPQTFSQVFKKYYSMSPMDYRKNDQWGKSVFFTDPSKESSILYNFVRKEDDEFFGDIYYFHMNITDRSDFWSPAQEKIDQMRINSFSHNCVYKVKAAITCFPNPKRKNFLTAEYIYGVETSLLQGKRRVFVPSGNYLKATKTGTLSDFHEISNNLYRDVLYVFNLKKRDGCDYEEIMRLDLKLFEFSYYIPIKI